jgi:hypothetical protein
MLLASCKDLIVVGRGSEAGREVVTSQAFEPGVDEKFAATASQSPAVSCRALRKRLVYSLASVTFFR